MKGRGGIGRGVVPVTVSYIEGELGAPIDGELYGQQGGEWTVIPATGIEEAPIDGGSYARQDAGWVPAAGAGTVTSVEISGTDGIEVDSGSPITGAGTIQLGVDTGGMLTKLGVEAGATADQTDSEIETAYNAQVDVVSTVDAEAGTSTVVKRWTPERVGEAIAALGGGGGSGTKVLIETITNATAGKFDFSSIPSTYKRLRLQGTIRGDVSALTDTVHILFNALTTTGDYHYQFHVAIEAATHTAGEGSGVPIGVVVSATAAANLYTTFDITIEDYAGSNLKVAVNKEYGGFETTTRMRIGTTMVGHKTMTAAIDRVRLQSDNDPTDELFGEMSLYGEL